jgi:hypothetical protein
MAGDLHKSIHRVAILFALFTVTKSVRVFADSAVATQTILFWTACRAAASDFVVRLHVRLHKERNELFGAGPCFVRRFLRLRMERTRTGNS